MNKKIFIFLIISILVSAMSFFAGRLTNQGITEEIAVNIANSVIEHKYGYTSYLERTLVEVKKVDVDNVPCYEVYRYWDDDVQDGDCTVIIDKTNGRVLSITIGG